MSGIIIQVINGGTIYPVLVNLGHRIVEQAVDHRMMDSIVAGEGVERPADLVGREVELSADGMTIAFV
jgi:hypothetical protein